MNALADDTTTSIKNVNDQIATVNDLTSDAAKNVFSTLQVLAEQVKTAAVAEKAAPGSGSIDFTDVTKVAASANNNTPEDIKLSIDTITEGTSNLVIGTLRLDSDQPEGRLLSMKL